MRMRGKEGKNRLVDLVCFVYPVDLVHLVIFVQQKNQTNETNHVTGFFCRRSLSLICAGRAIDQSIEGSL
jgi:hypothetical protein